jgi:hypothetical protein
LGAAIVVSTVALFGQVWAKGGLSVKPPRPFTRQELILIEQCRRLARLQGADSAAFLRQCSAERPYVNP